MNNEQICHSRIVATALSRGLKTQDDRGLPSSFELSSSIIDNHTPVCQKIL